MANSTDSISIFAEGTFEEQILELLSYIARNRNDEDRTAFVAPFQNALKSGEGKKPIEEDENRRKLILSKLLVEIRGLGDGSDKEIEGFFNLVFAHIFSLYPFDSPEVKQYLDAILNTISGSPSERLSVKYRVLSNLFNSLPKSSPLRLSVYRTILQIATSKDNLNALELTKSDVQKWLSEWEITNEEKSVFLKAIVDAYVQAEELTVAYEYSLQYVQTLAPSSEEAKVAALDVIATALRLPGVFDFDPLFKLDAVINVKDHELFSLLQVFLNGGLPEFNAWQSKHSPILEKYQIPTIELERKIRLLTLASLAFSHIGQNLSYSRIAEGLQVDLSEVEKWVIDVIRAGLVWGKLSQTTQSLHISRATSRSFEREQWQALEKRLVAWKSGLAGILDVVVTAKRQGGQIAA
ncbi:Eukaryotic translation initiation factor 3 subunit M [Psilocybe cubensis]|uniref:Eukaryotic translation initiation factor 3 subunit M n=2 Tax=Psilocybe cubensis TaxID=181762 RepID=A0ACB8H4L0_PSICU|nr:Eukaryotic translation initiation factor 3 subunit M [Psilocybe cubensis]KAH9482943.1 Eukaryotic translation initiation factor 3 subunit M [Psilocybe cubensis]